MKYIEKVSPTVMQYKCKDCGCLCNVDISVETVEEKKSNFLCPELFWQDKDRLRKNKSIVEMMK